MWYLGGGISVRPFLGWGEGAGKGNPELLALPAELRKNAQRTLPLVPSPNRVTQQAEKNRKKKTHPEGRHQALWIGSVSCMPVCVCVSLSALAGRVQARAWMCVCELTHPRQDSGDSWDISIFFSGSVQCVF